jgi:hypothetical protein
VELESIRNKTIMEMWNGELDALRQEYIIYKRERNYGISTSNLKQGGSETKKQDKIKTKKMKKGSV